MNKMKIYTSETCGYCKTLKEELNKNGFDSYKKPVYSESRRTLEKIKTLHYGTNMAFSRLDQLLRKIETKINKEDEHKSTS